MALQFRERSSPGMHEPDGAVTPTLTRTRCTAGIAHYAVPT